MTPDHIRHLCGLLAKACPMYARASTYHANGKLVAHVFHANVSGHELIKIEGEPANVRLIVDMLPRLPALLAVAEAARISNSALKRGRPQIRGILVEQDFDLAIRESDAALAKLDEVRP